jgi:hypothetical protein
MPNTSRFIQQWIKINVLRHLILQQIKLENKNLKLEEVLRNLKLN